MFAPNAGTHSVVEHSCVLTHPETGMAASVFCGPSDFTEISPATGSMCLAHF